MLFYLNVIVFYMSYVCFRFLKVYMFNRYMYYKIECKSFFLWNKDFWKLGNIILYIFKIKIVVY